MTTRRKVVPSQTIAQLRLTASNRLLSIPSKATKNEIIAILTENKPDYNKIRIDRFLIINRWCNIFYQLNIIAIIFS